MRVVPKAGAAMLSLLLVGGGVGVVVGVPGVANAQDATAMVRSAADSDLVVTDNYPALYGWLANSLGDATTVKIATTCGVSDGGNGTTTIPAQVTQLVGWQAKSWFDEEGEKVRQLGYASSYETLTFASGATTEVRSLTLKLLDDRLVVPAGANVTFKNCTFVNRVKIEKGGKATFENCTLFGHNPQQRPGELHRLDEGAHEQGHGRKRVSGPRARCRPVCLERRRAHP